MVRGKKAKTVSLIVTLIILILQCFDVPAESVGIRAGSPAYTHLVYPFFHDGFIHAALNCYVMLSVVFLYDISFAVLLIAYVLATTYPAGLFCTELPTVGLSGVCYVLMGSISFRVKDKIMYQTYMILSIVLGFFFPFINPIVHLYCYVAGWLVGFLNSPVKDDK